VSQPYGQSTFTPGCSIKWMESDTDQVFERGG